jgi:predicted nucleic acid-binding protein
LEVALEQEEVGAAEAILRLGEERKIDLAFPTFALIEPFWTIQHRGAKRRDLCESLNKELLQLRRAASHQQLASSLQRAPLALLDIEKREMDSLESTARRLLNVGKAIEIDGSVFGQALGYQSRYGLSTLDGVIYAAVIADLNRRASAGPKCFITDNPKDFLDPGIKEELASYDCRVIASFNDGLDFIKSRIK